MRRLIPPQKDPLAIEFYEGLVRKTAGRYAGIVEEEYEDICSILRIKVWRALESFDASKSNLPVERYVFSCLRNQVKDLLKRKRHNDLYIEDIAPQGNRGGFHDGLPQPVDRFEGQYMLTTEEEVFSDILGETPLIPSTLDLTERKVLVCMYLDYQQREIATSVGVSMREVARAVKSIKDKMMDWKPSANGPAITTTNDKGVDDVDASNEESVPQP